MKSFNLNKQQTIQISYSEIKSRAKEMFETNSSMGEIFESLHKEFPQWQTWIRSFFTYELPSPPKRGFNVKNFKLSFLLDMRIEDLIEEGRKRRGLLISKGLNSSELHKSKASASAAKLQKNKITKAQRILYEIITHFDPSATLEKTIKCSDGKIKSFDIYSPRIDGFFEMHGLIWHNFTYASSLKHSKPNFLKKVKQNIKNDKIKRALILSMDKKLYVFWDNKMMNWTKRLCAIYNEFKEIDIEQIKNKVSYKDRYKRSI
jgi:G:T-mismatch repair DNA endonuclease (very short patch repair protein)